jgi:Flp pilus assembly protein TadG
VEFALIAPLLFLLVFGIIDFGLGLSASVTVNNAAREGARLAAVDPDPARVDAAVRAATKSLNQAALSVTVACARPDGTVCPGGLAGGASGDQATVTVTYNYGLVTPLTAVIGSTMKIETASNMRIE